MTGEVCYSCGRQLGEWDDDFEEFITIEDELCSHCRRIRDEQGDDSYLTEYFEGRYVMIGGKAYRSIKCSGNVHPCSECGRPIYGVPLLIWGNGGETMVAFCHKCAEVLVYPYLIIKGRECS